MTIPQSHNLPLWRTNGVVITTLLHAGPVEFLYYWFHRALHHHYLYSRYHSHHHSSIVTEPITCKIILLCLFLQEQIKLSHFIGLMEIFIELSLTYFDRITKQRILSALEIILCSPGCYNKNNKKRGFVSSTNKTKSIPCFKEKRTGYLHFI